MWRRSSARASGAAAKLAVFGAARKMRIDCASGGGDGDEAHALGLGARHLSSRRRRHRRHIVVNRRARKGELFLFIRSASRHRAHMSVAHETRQKLPPPRSRRASFEPPPTRIARPPTVSPRRSLASQLANLLSVCNFRQKNHFIDNKNCYNAKFTRHASINKTYLFASTEAAIMCEKTFI